MDTSILEKIGFTKITGEEDKTISGGYVGDMLSWVMGRARAGNCWFTIINNLNTIAVASLVDVSAIVFCDGVTLDNAVIDKAKEEDINIYYTKLSTFEAVVAFNDIFSKDND